MAAQLASSRFVETRASLWIVVCTQQVFHNSLLLDPWAGDKTRHLRPVEQAGSKASRTHSRLMQMC